MTEQTEDFDRGWVDENLLHIIDAVTGSVLTVTITQALKRSSLGLRIRRQGPLSREQICNAARLAINQLYPGAISDSLEPTNEKLSINSWTVLFRVTGYSYQATKPDGEPVTVERTQL